MEKLYKIYKHTFPNGKKYIGITKQDLKCRWKNGLGYNKNYKIGKAIKKYGWDNITHEIIDYADNLDEANQKEMMYIKLYDTVNFGYNTTYGGDGTKGHKVSKTTRELIRKKNSGRKPSEEEKAKLKIAMSKKVIQLDNDKKIIKVWNSTRDIERELGYSHSSISYCCRNITKQSHGYKWIYEKDYYN